MNQFNVKVKGGAPQGQADSVRPVFVWNAPEECRQFTVQVARDREFRELLLMRDTHERYLVFDSTPLKQDATYYVRVRSGLGEWSWATFITKS